MLFKNIAVVDSEWNIADDMFVAVSGCKIAYVGSNMPTEDFGTVYDGRGKLMLPAFVNAHGHTPMTIMRGYGENMVLDEWLNKKIFPFEAQLTGDDVYWSTMLGLAEMIRFGTVSVNDMYYFGSDMVRAVSQAGTKCNLSTAVTCFDGSHLQELPVYGEIKDLFKNHHDDCDGRIRIDMSIHAEYTSSERVVREMAELAGEFGTGVHVHLSETKKEHEECKQRHGGLTPAQYFAECGLFDRRAVAAHCVYIEGEDFDILRDKGVTVATCPKSNLKLASGICDAANMYKKGVNLAIGTDSAASNNNLNMLEEIKTFALIQKYKAMDPTIVTPKEALKAATIGGAISQGREDTGLIREGYKADIVVLDVSAPYMQPVHSLINNVVYSSCGTDVCLTMADGKVLYEDGEYATIDVEQAVRQVKLSRKRILSV